MGGRREPASCLGVRCERGQPAELEKALHVGARSVAGEDERALLVLLAQECQIACVHPRSVLLDVQRIAVVPDGDEPELVRGCRDGRAGAEDEDGTTLEGAEEATIAIGIGLPRVDACDEALIEERAGRPLDVSDVSVVGHAHDRAASPGQRHRGKFSQGLGEGGHPRAIAEGDGVGTRAQGDAVLAVRG